MNFSIAITGLYTSLLVLLFIALSINVIRQRFKHKVGLGSKEIKELEQAIRIHGNFAEYIPLALIMLAALELSGLDAMWLHVFGGALLFGRIAHAIGLSKSIGTSIPRALGVVTTFITLLAMAVTFLLSY
ncbi:MAPEG family protein [Colwellia sp. MEBiC06753]